MREDRLEGLRILHLEDSPDDAQLVQRCLVSNGIGAAVTTTSRPEEFERLLKEIDWDLVLSDFNLPGFDGPSALSLVRRTRPDVPFIIVSGAIGEDRAVEVLVRGATDYVLKDRLSKLPMAVRRAIENARETRLRREAETRLVESEERFRLLMRATADVVYDVDAGAGTVWWNENFGPTFAYRPEEIGRTSAWWGGRIHEEDRERVLDGLRQTLDRRESRWQAEYLFYRGDGQCSRVLDRATLLYDESGNPRRRVGSMMDVTELRSLQQQFLQAQKMEAIGRLAGGMAHDFNNILTVINGYSELILSQLPEGDPKRPEIEDILAAGRRGAGLTRQLLAFSRKQIIQPVSLDLNDLVAQLEKMITRLLGEDVELVFVPGRKLSRVVADPGQIELAILNLVVNARDAMPNGGKITIQTSNVELDHAYANGNPEARPGPHVLLSVRDTGSGMDKATLARLFEPFFTTKEPGKGTGLGLSTVRSIVKQSGGSIEVQSEPGHGSTFKIHLPREEAAGRKRETRAKVTPAPVRGSETVLLAEDVENIRRLGQVILEGAGYLVLPAAEGSEAVRICERHSGPIHLLITDLVMRSMSGRELADVVRRARPETKILYMSGYTDRDLADLGLEDPGVALLQKPFTVEGLVRKVRDVLDVTP